TDGAQGKDARITLADLQAAGGKLSKGLLTQHGEPGQAVKLADQTVNGGTMNMSTTLKISARYYKTAATVTAGQANATATLNLTY
ncbi:flagellar hook-length control protein FliK, partial [Salmonella enterica subsp. enterica serovar Anatum]|nr:flagellar hook-length control protein FliK [Salmonella enterica subsp. enterica serovar Anatum]